MTLQAQASPDGDLTEQGITDSYLVDAILEPLPVSRRKETNHFIQNLHPVENNRQELDDDPFTTRQRKRRSALLVKLFTRSKTGTMKKSLGELADPNSKLSRLIGEEALQNMLKGADKSPAKEMPKGKRRYRKTLLKQFTKPGIYKNALQDFVRMNPIMVTEIKSGTISGFTGRVGNMQVTVRNSSKSLPKRPTMDIYDINRPNKIKMTIYKFRYTGLRRHEKVP